MGIPYTSFTRANMPLCSLISFSVSYNSNKNFFYFFVLNCRKPLARCCSFGLKTYFVRFDLHLYSTKIQVLDFIFAEGWFSLDEKNEKEKSTTSSVAASNSWRNSITSNICPRVYSTFSLIQGLDNICFNCSSWLLSLDTCSLWLISCFFFFFFY